MMSVRARMAAAAVAALLVGSPARAAESATGPTAGAGMGTSMPAPAEPGVTVRGVRDGAALRVQVVEDLADAERAERADEESRRREASDLAAQQSMADSTRQLVDISWWQGAFALAGAVLSLVGTVAVVVALWLSREANRAAMRAVELSEKVARTELRAYLVFEDVVVDQRPSRPMGVSFLFRNCGSTPAFIEYYKFNAIFREGSGWVKMNWTQKKVSTVIGAGQILDIVFELPAVGVDMGSGFVTYEDIKVFIGLDIDYRTIFPDLKGRAEVVLVRERAATDFSFGVAGEEDQNYFRERISRPGAWRDRA
ncbi:cytochrome P450 [Ancylobacter sp. Lp-2]|nr:cytochrome P450 [Ancylobacter sp. Lp-2]